jgi:hypothetical protein
MTTHPKPNLRCPLCGGANACAAATTGRFDAPCWCRSATFPAALLARIPAPLRDVACVCAACVAAVVGPQHDDFAARANVGES